jgi:hypothetical protein
MKKTILLSLLIFGISMFQGFTTSAAGSYEAGSLLALEGVQDAAVYYIGSDGMKYVFPDSKTYYTWYENFNAVVKVDVAELDMYEDGGAMPYRAGTKLITHMNTAKIYAVDASGNRRWIPSSEVAVSLYGDSWTSLVQDVIPGYFSSTYTAGDDLSDTHPDGTVLSNEQTLYYVEDSRVRPFSDVASLTANNLNQSYAIEVADISNYTIGDPITSQETPISSYAPYWVCCTNNVATPYVYIYLVDVPDGEFDPNNIDQFFMEIAREVNLDSDTTEDKIQSALQELFSINEYTDTVSGYNSLLYPSDLEINAENNNDQITINLSGSLSGVGALADMFIKPQITKTIEYYTDNYIIKLNGTEAEWECALDTIGDCN